MSNATSSIFRICSFVTIVLHLSFNVMNLLDGCWIVLSNCTIIFYTNYTHNMKLFLTKSSYLYNMTDIVDNLIAIIVMLDAGTSYIAVGHHHTVLGLGSLV